MRSSHEWWDGSGYPDGLAGEDIPLEARIIAVCDAFQAMTTHRPYRQARTSQDAVTELRRCAGTQFDPRVVQGFDASVEAGLHAQWLETRRPMTFRLPSRRCEADRESTPAGYFAL